MMRGYRTTRNNLSGRVIVVVLVVILLANVFAMCFSSKTSVMDVSRDEIYSRNLIALHEDTASPGNHSIKKTTSHAEVPIVAQETSLEKENSVLTEHRLNLEKLAVSETKMELIVDNNTMVHHAHTMTPDDRATAETVSTDTKNSLVTTSASDNKAYSSAESSNSTHFSFELSRSRPYNSNIKLIYSCKGRNQTPKEQLDRYFDFNTHIQTPLNLLVMGDSLAVELGKGMQIAGGVQDENLLEHLHFSKTDTREHETLSAHTVRGGGTVAYWRVLGYWLKRYIGKRMPNFGRGWLPSYGESLLNYTKLHAHHDKFDVLIFRTSHPWMKTNQVKAQFMNATVEMAKEVLGIETTILLTSPLNNNVMTMKELTEFREMNQRIRDFASSTKRDVRLCDMGRFVEEVIDYNAEGLGGNFSEPIFLHKLKVKDPTKPFAPSIAQLCAEKVRDGARSCKKNSYFNDGLHLCMETLGPRLYAAIGCLIECPSHDKSCEAACNEKFMSLNRISEQDYSDSSSSLSLSQ